MLNKVLGLFGYEYIVGSECGYVGILSLNGEVVFAPKAIVKTIRQAGDPDGGPGAFGAVWVEEGISGDHFKMRWRFGRVILRLTQ